MEKPLIYIPYTNGSKDNALVNPVSRMLMIQAHLETGHESVFHTLSRFRNYFLVSRGRQLAQWVRKIVQPVLNMMQKLLQLQ